MRASKKATQFEALEKLAFVQPIPGFRDVVYAEARKVHRLHDSKFTLAMLAQINAAWSEVEQSAALLQRAERAGGLRFLEEMILRGDNLQASQALMAVGYSRQASAAALLVRHFHRKSSTAARALEVIGPAAVPEVAKLFRDANPKIRADAVKVLARIGTAKDVPAIEALTTDSNGLVRLAAKQAIEEINKRDLTAFEMATAGRPRSPSKRTSPGGISKQDSTPVDLLKRIDLKRDVVKGEWRFEGRKLLVPDGSFQRIQVPVSLPASYRLRLRVSKIGEPKLFFMLGLLLDGRQVGLCIGRETLWLAWLDGNGTKQGNMLETPHHGTLFQKDGPTSLEITVRPGAIIVSSEDTALLQVIDGTERLQLHPLWKVPDAKSLILGGLRGAYAIHQFEMLPIDTTP